MKTTNKSTVTYIDHMGSDVFVADAARVSFNKVSYTNDDGTLTDKDEKLIKYLAEHNHWSPFSHCFIKFRVKAPIFVARQLQKHTVGLAWNEVSRRYVDEEPEFYFPDKWRKRAENKKQGSSNVTTMYDITPLMGVVATWYDAMLASGIAPEQSRMILPQNMMTEWIWSGSLYAFARVVNLRTSDHAQQESGDVAKQIAAYLKSYFPVSSRYLLNPGVFET